MESSSANFEAARPPAEPPANRDDAFGAVQPAIPKSADADDTVAFHHVSVRSDARSIFCASSCESDGAGAEETDTTSLQPLESPPPFAASPARCTIEIDPGGMTNVGFRLKMIQPRYKIATVVAGNSGRPGGACGLADGGVTLLHAEHRTQEEDIVSNWLITTCRNAHEPVRGEYASGVYSSTIFGKWGMVEAEGVGMETVQGVDYTVVGTGFWYADAWCVEGAALSVKERRQGRQNQHPPPFAYDANRQYSGPLVFVSGPNCGAASDHPSSTTRRTLNTQAAIDYNVFRSGVQCALYAALRAAALLRADCVLIPFVSGGIYAGPWRSRLAADFEAIINEVLEADGQGRHAPLGQYFEMVVWTVLEPPTRLV